MTQMESPGRVIGMDLNVSESQTIEQVGAMFAHRDGVNLADYFFTIDESVNGAPVWSMVDANRTLRDLGVGPGRAIWANFTEAAKARHNLLVNVFDERGRHVALRSLYGTEKFQRFKKNICMLLNSAQFYYTFWFDDIIIKDLDTPYSVGMYRVDQRSKHNVPFVVTVVSNPWITSVP